MKYKLKLIDRGSRLNMRYLYPAFYSILSWSEVRLNFKFFLNVTLAHTDDNCIRLNQEFSFQFFQLTFVSINDICFLTVTLKCKYH